MTPRIERWVRAGEGFLGHTVAVVIGFVMMVVGLAMGVTLVMLPIGVFLGLLGVGALVAAGAKDLPLPPNA